MESLHPPLVSRCVRYLPTLPAGSSLGAAARAMKEVSAPIVAVHDRDRLLGAITETGLARAKYEGAQDHDVLDKWVDRVPVVKVYELIDTVLENLVSSGFPAAIVLDDNRAVQGLVSISDLLAPGEVMEPPASVGGMATPMGVYLTNGAFGIGVSKWALITTGALLMVLITLSIGVTIPVEAWLRGLGVHKPWITTGSAIASSAVFMMALRFMPLSGYHGAEHQVVHAIERGEDLVPEVVRRMPRVHPRCGTNLAVGASLFFYLGTAEWIVEPELRLLVAVAVTLLLWKRLGNFLQQYVTTKVPTDHQLDMGIRSGKEFLRAYESAKVIKPTGHQRIIATGMPFVVIGTTLAYAVIALLAYLLGYGDLVGV